MNTETTTTQTVEEKVNELWGEREDISPYHLAGLASTLVGRYVREQQVYQYVSKNLIHGCTKNADGKKRVSREGAVEWLVKYATKHTA